MMLENKSANNLKSCWAWDEVHVLLHPGNLHNISIDQLRANFVIALFFRSSHPAIPLPSTRYQEAYEYKVLYYYIISL